MFGRRRNMMEDMMEDMMERIGVERNNGTRNMMYSLLAVGLGSLAYSLIRNRTNMMENVQPALQPIADRFTQRESVPNEQAPFTFNMEKDKE